MATAHARREYKGNKIAIGTVDRRWYWSPIFDNNPIIATPTEIRGRTKVDWIVNASGCRPYINYDVMEKPIKTAPRFYYNEIGPLDPGEIYFTNDEKPQILTGRYIVIEPNIKENSVSPNKQWGIDKFQSVVNALPHVRFVQPKYGMPILDSVEPIETKSFRDACRLIRDSIGYLGNEGGLHHAAAAVCTPAIVIFGGYHSPKVTGYAEHINLSIGDPCGIRAPCEHCKEVMESITVEMVCEKVHFVYGDN